MQRDREKCREIEREKYRDGKSVREREEMQMQRGEREMQRWKECERKRNTERNAEREMQRERGQHVTAVAPRPARYISNQQPETKPAKQNANTKQTNK